MIRVNLMRNRVQDAGTTNQAAPGAANEAKEAIFKLGMMSVFTVVLIIYQNQNISRLNLESARLKKQVADLQVQAEAKAQEVEGIKEIATQAQELEDKLKVLKLLSRLRLREVKTLDFMQSSIPEKVWLKGLSYESDRVQVERGQYWFKGQAVTTDDLTDFVKRLDDSAYLNEVIVIKNQELLGPGRTGNIRDYLFTAEVELKN